MRLRSYGVCEHVCPVTGIPRVRRDEERDERCTICTTDTQGLVVPKEETTCVRCRQQVERASDMRLIAEALAMIERRREPVVSRQCRGISGREVAEVIVGDAD